MSENFAKRDTEDVTVGARWADADDDPYPLTSAKATATKDGEDPVDAVVTDAGSGWRNYTWPAGSLAIGGWRYDIRATSEAGGAKVLAGGVITIRAGITQPDG